MNDKLDDLMYQAGLTAQGCWDEMDKYDRTSVLKFAELIIYECLSICEELGDKGMDGHYCADKILKHFGVKE
jgi:hypothetical protein